MYFGLPVSWFHRPACLLASSQAPRKSLMGPQNHANELTHLPRLDGCFTGRRRQRSLAVHFDDRFLAGLLPGVAAAAAATGTNRGQLNPARFSPLFSPRGEAKCVRSPSVQGARRSARGGVLEQYVEHGEQAQRSNGGLIACFDRQVVRNAG